MSFGIFSKKVDSKVLRAATALQPAADFNRRILDALVMGDAGREALMAGVVKKDASADADARWEKIKAAKAALSVAELAGILQGMAAEGKTFDAAKAQNPARATPFNDQAFYDALAKNIQTAEKIQKELEDLKAEEKKKAGYVKRAFAVFSDPKAAEKAVRDAEALEHYFYKNGIKYDAKENKLVQSEKPRTGWDTVWDNRFLIAAGGGAALGFAGLNLGLLPLLGATPGLFFGALPWLAAPFIGLNVFKSFSHYGILKESRTLLGFLGITTAGLAIAAGVTAVMTGLLPVVNPASFAATTIPGMAGGFSPMQYMLPIIAGFTGAALLYKRARAAIAGTDQPGENAGKLSKIYNKAVGLVVNKHTAPWIAKLGALGEKGTDLINKAFPKFIDVVGIPAVATLLSITMATGGLGLLGAFAGYYVTAFTGMAVGFGAMMAAYAGFGARGKDFKEIFKAAAAGFSISSSSATMPTEKEVLRKMGVSQKTRDTVVPLGGVFNMYGTSLYMGLTAFYALSMFGATPTAMQYFNTAMTVIGIALGAPGIPASNITLLDPVLRQTGLQAADINKVYTMILPADRILDMTQTGLNVMGDMLPAVEQDRKKLRYVRAKNIRKIREERQKQAINDNKQDVTAPVKKAEEAKASPAAKITPPAA